jgi:hypothetical protein
VPGRFEDRSLGQSCGKLTAAGTALRVRVMSSTAPEGPTGIYTCRTARRVLRKYAKSRPSMDRPTGEVRYRGRTWSCYLIRDDSGYNCLHGYADERYLSGRFARR